MSVSPSKTPGYYLAEILIDWTFSADVVGVAMSINAAPPSISKYIAYDNLPARNPFIAVTEDGRGRVVYDGGFPKFYNETWNNAVNFSQLTGEYKFLHNAIKWCANASKVSVGNKKVLILGDAITAQSYAIKNPLGGGFNGFFTSLTAICNVAGFTPTFKDRADYAGVLNPTLAELETYTLVILMSTDSGAYNAPTLITPTAINDLVTYRENGNGIIIITDHGPLLNTIAEAGAYASPEGSFFKTANRLAIKFGTYFTGNYDRTPVSLAFIRSNYGDHALYSGMSDAESIVAGGSESKVVVPIIQLAPPPISATYLNTVGLNSVNFLTTKADGSIETFKFTYSIAGTDLLDFKDKNNVAVTTAFNVGVSNKFEILPKVNGVDLGTVWGEITLDGKRVGEVAYSAATGSLAYVYGSDVGAGGVYGFNVKHASVLMVTLKSPFTYSKAITIDKVNSNASKQVSTANLIQSIGAAYGVKEHLAASALKWINGQIAPFLQPSEVKPPISMADQIKRIGDYEKGLLSLAPIVRIVFDSQAQATSYMNLNTVNVGVIILVVEGNCVWGYLAGAWTKLPALTPYEALGGKMMVTASNSGSKYNFDNNKLLIKV